MNLVNKLESSNGLKKFITQYVQLIGSTGISIILQFIGIKLFTYLLGPSVYGDYRLVTNMLQLLQIMVVAGIPFTIAYLVADPKLNRENSGKIISAGSTLLVGSLLLWFVIVVLFVFSQSWFGYEVINSSWLFYYFFAAAIIIQYYADYVLMGLNEIKHIAIKNIVTQIIQISLLFAYMFFVKSMNYTMTLLDCMLVFAIGNIVYPIYLFRKFKIPLFTNKESLKKVNKINIEIGIPVYLGSILSVASTYLVNIFVRYYTTSIYYAQFGLAVQVASPLGMLLASVGSVFFKRFRSEDRISPKFLGFLFFMAAFAALGYVISIQYAIPLLFGKNYSGAIIYAQIIGVGALMVGVGDIINRFLSSKGKSKAVRNAAIVSGISNLVLAYFLLPRLGLLGASLASIGSNAAYLFAILWFYFRYLKHIKKEFI